jgi:hypothetical protein
VFATAFIALYVAHQVADHWVQTQTQADRKGLPGWPGRRACLAHVATYTLTQAVVLVAVLTAASTTVPVGRAAAALAVSAASHYIVDRRRPLRRMADALGKSPAWLEHGGGMYALDQSWHIGWIGAAALLLT